ncbi:MFS transporter [Arthrobacter sp. zg-Y820]|uniref:MFS transporter n=1 Tax=unclassified Arthrobacter TaxID=235627 RepID=UPI001E4A7F91|nr:MULTISPECIES: MFS transporter [unclassified Arthrobacter]MCC9195722.1 MFS transporter [Arthrobacter sp. zg-Y820]MDK1278581.1 MFS transporter [Arthrobacter sp. zg.Y820]MDK1359821.1 MFS transporter [Arthrobacter sp. zg-Y1219]WIB08986.1 MFS transporter [Arthrobacter sp. zg-Y820]
MPRLLADLSPLRESPEYRRLWTGTALSAVGTQLTLVAVSLEVYSLTSSSFYVGLLGLVGLIPLIVAGLYGGSIVDAYDRRKVALLSSVLLWVSTIGIAAQAWAGVGNIWLLYALVAVNAGASGLNHPARSAIIPRLVRPELLPAANALSMITFGLAMTVGPLLAGVLVARVGYGWTYTIDVVTFTAAMWAVYRLPPMPPEGEVQKAGLKSVLDGFRFLATRPNIRMTFLVDLAAMVMAQPRALLPAVGALLLGGGATTVGVLLAATAVGAFLAGLFSGPLGAVRRQGLAVLWSVAAWGLSVSAFGAVVVMAGRNEGDDPSAWLIPAAVAMGCAGIADSVSGVFRSTILQSATPDAMRGRLQGVFVVVVAGGPRLGDLVAGVDASFLGEGWAAVIGGLVCVVLVGVLARRQPRFARYDARHPEP